MHILLCKAILLFCFLSLVMPHKSVATHIVGGELNYRCLGEDQYELTLSVFRNCYGSEGFDNPAVIGIFSQYNQLLTELGDEGYVKTKYTGVENVPYNRDDPCVIMPPNLCVERATYIDTVTLPYRRGGYVLSYFVCCRTNIITNIHSVTTKATYVAEITEEALNACNANPVFKDWPPISICLEEPLKFDHSAFEKEGDSLVYELCTPIEGGANPDQSFPPYFPVEWIDPPYSLDSIWIGEPIRIDEESGLLTGTPTELGQYIVGVCVKQYREGVLLSTTRRDFQINVRYCSKKAIAFFTTDTTCETDSFIVHNQSENADSFEWRLDVPEYRDSVFHDSNPVFGPLPVGTHTLQLIAYNNDGCVDTFTSNITVIPYLPASFSYFRECGSPQVEFINGSDAGMWMWNFGDGDSSFQENPVHVYSDSGEYTVSLSSTDVCMSSVSKTVNVNLIEENISDTFVICANQPVELNPGGDTSDNYQWSPEEFLDDPISANPTAIVDETTLFTVDIQEDSDTCTLTKEVLVIVEDLFVLTTDDELICEGDTVKLTAEEVRGRDSIKLTWEPTDVIISETTKNRVWAVIDETTTYTVTAMTPEGCVETETRTIIVEQLNPDVQIIIDPDTTIEFGVDVQLDVLNGKDPPIWTYNWSPPESLISPTDKRPLLENPRDTTLYTVTITTENGCVFELSQTLNVIQSLCKHPYVFLPNAFSPNGDGSNDVLYLRGEYVNQMELIIYNKWGEKVFHSTDQNTGWDGMTNGKMNDSGGYAYYLSVTCQGGEIYTEQGNITIMR